MAQRLYLDANIFIYSVEAESSSPLRPALDALFGAADDGDCVFVTSELTLAELLPLPIRLGREDRVALYLEMFSPASPIEARPVSRPVIESAARLRARSGLRLPDALHVAAALEAGCGTFVTNDLRLRPPEGLPLDWKRLEDFRPQERP